MTGRLMSQRYPAAAVTVDALDPAMTFEEIGRVLGVDKRHVYFWFVSGLNKIRKNPEACRRLLELYEAKLTQDQLAELKAKNIRTDVHEWAGVGKEVGEAVNSSLAAITTQSNNFAQTGVGRVTIALVVWKVLGDQAVHILGGIIEVIILLPLWLWSYRRVCLPRRIVIEESISNDKTKTRKWKLINEDETDLEVWRFTHIAIGAGFLIVILTTIFSY